MALRKLDNPYQIVDTFEKLIAEYAGSKYAVAVESCSAALFLSLEYTIEKDENVWIPKHTYPSVPNAIIHAGGHVKYFTDEENNNWSGVYELSPFEIWDGALRFKRNMYQGGLHCLSFHIKKLLPIGRGGMILTDDKEAYEHFKLARFDGRHPIPLKKDNITTLGWNMYMEPANAARGIQLFELIKDKELEDIDPKTQGYSDLSKLKIYD